MLGIVALNAAAAIKAGASTVDITPPQGAAMSGYFFNRSATATHDPLLARALVFENDGVRIALVSCDLTSMPEGIATAARIWIQDLTGIPQHQVMISATHAHTAPVLLSGWSRYQLDGEMKRIATTYSQTLPALIAQSVVAAVKALRPAKVFATIGHEATLPFNRRFHMRDGTVAWNPGKLNPNIVKPAGPIDPAVPVVYVEGEDGQAIAVYVNYAMHLDTVGGLEYSADYVYALTEALKVARGRQLVTVFTMGCSGNINHIDTAAKRPQKGHTEAARIGTILAAAVLRSIDDAAPVNDTRLSGKSTTIQLAAVKTSPDEVAAATEARSKSTATLVLANAARILENDARSGRPYQAEIQILRMGKDLVWLGLPGEIFVELGLDIKQNSKARFTVIATQTNAALGYIPNSKAYPEGTYEVISARVVSGSGEALVQTALDSINSQNIP